MSEDFRDRYRAVARAQGMEPWYRMPHDFGPLVLGDLPPARWRVSRDEWDRLLVEVADYFGDDTFPSPTMQAKMYGWDINPDDSLPPQTILLERLDGQQDGTQEPIPTGGKAR